MPFKLKLKKTRQYNVASKSLFVISVELLDGGGADCTLSVESTGQECLDNVCQRQAINQPEFFGLRYINRSQQLRWVQLDRPLKRQLDKSASSHQLYLRVMYYVISGTSLITDEVTRYHYFLQLKNDLVEGRIICDCQQAVVLASYSRQAEYGNHDRERHTVEYLKNLLTFPKQMIDNGQLIDGSTLAETGRLEWLTAAVIQHHMALHNMSQAQAEEGFITTCQQLRGYGQEVFLVQEQASQAELAILVSLSGITTRTAHSQHLYRWRDITNVINHKRTFSIECQKQAESGAFVLPSPEEGKYVWRMCVLQHTFYMKHAQAEPAHHDAPTMFHAAEAGIGDSRSSLDVVPPAAPAPAPAPRLSPAHSLELDQPPPLPRNRALLPSYRPAPDYETAVQHKYQQRASPPLRYPPLAAPLAPLAPLARAGYGSHPDIHRIHYPDVTRHNQTEDYPFGLKFVGNFPLTVNPNGTDVNVNQMHYVNVYKPPPPYPSNGLASNSTPDLAVASQAMNYHRAYINNHVSGSSPDLVSTRTALNRQYLGYLNSGSHVVNYNRTVMPGAHGTYNNLAAVLDPNSHIIMDPHHISDNIQKVYDERGNIMYSMPIHRIPYQRHIVVSQQHVAQSSDSHEPIYENVPLPWQNQGRGVRDRAHSLTTTDEIARINERNATPINKYNNLKTTVNIAGCDTEQDANSHYVNAQIIKGVRESSAPRELCRSARSINNNDDFENVTLSVDRLSLRTEDKDFDETPYQSLSTHKVSNNNTINKENYSITIKVPDITISDSSDVSRSLNSDVNRSHSSGVGSALSNSILNSTNSTDVDSSTTKSSVSAKEKKRRRWGVFMGRATKTTDVKSATLGRDKAKVEQPPNKHRWSTGLPKFQPLPPSISKESLCQILERKMTDEQLAFAFEQIPKERSGGGPLTTALLPAHAPLNHCARFLPYDDNRVRLACSQDNPHGYINASHVTMTVGSSQRFFVVGLVGRAGTSSQHAALWECAASSGAKLLVLLGHPHYLPHDNSTQHYGKWVVKVGSRSSAEWGGSVRVTLREGGGAGAGGAGGVAGGGARRARSLWHVHYSGWPDDQNLPTNFNHYLAFLSELEGLRLAAEAEAAPALLARRNLPLLLLGSSSGATVGLTLLAHLLLHHTNQDLDIPRTIGMLHQQRANLIQNVHQYKYLHQILLHSLKQSRLI